MRTANGLSSSSLSLPKDSYIYTILPVSSTSLIASCSDNTLRIFSLDGLALETTISTSHPVLSSLVSSGTSHVVTAGSDGQIRGWDVRDSSSKPVFVNTNLGLGPITSLSLSGSKLAAGTELTNHAAVVTVWDARMQQSTASKTVQPLCKYDESHNDDVTELAWSPYGRAEQQGEARYLLSGGTDALINIYDTSQPDPDEALVKILNAESSVSHAGFLNDLADAEAIYSISHDEQMMTWKVPIRAEAGADTRYVDAEDADVDDATVSYGDVRPKLDCEYVVGVLDYGSEKIMGVGKHSEGRVDLIPLRPDAELAIGGNQSIRLPDSFGEEIVRTFYIDPDTEAIFTGGEDGVVRSWRVQDGAAEAEAAKTGPVRAKAKKGDSRARLFKPY